MCVGHDERNGPCRCPQDSRNRVRTADRAVADADREVRELRMQLSALPDTIDTLIAKRPDLSITIRKLHAAGFDMRVADDIRDPDGKPMLLIGERATDGAPIDSPAAGLSAPPDRQSVPARPRESLQKSPAKRVRYPDPSTFKRGTPEFKLQKQINRRGGRWRFPALFDLQGRPVPARRDITPYGERWLVYDNPELTGKPQYVSDSKSSNVNNRVSWLMNKGYQVGTVEARAQALPIRTNAGSEAIPVRLDDGFDPGATVVEVYTPANYVQRVDD